MKVLIADDNGVNRKLLRVILQSVGYETTEANDGVEALEILERDPVDIIVSDVLMPNMDGYRFCLNVRQHERFKDLPFIVHTSTHDSPGDEKIALSFGADAFIRRPAPAADVLQAIHEAAERAGAHRNARLQPPEELEVMKTYSVQLVRQLEAKNEELVKAHARTLEMHKALLKRTEELERSEAKFRSIFDNMLDVFYRTDMRGRIQIISPSIRRYGYQPEALIGTEIRALFVDPADHDRMVAALTEKQALEDAEFTLKHREGASFIASASVRLLTDARRRPLEIEGILRDITERKRLEEQLLHSQKLEAVGQLAGGIAHDFNNMLPAILGYAELAEEEIAPDTCAHEYIRTVESAARRAAALTQQLLAFARRQMIEPQVVVLNDLLLDLGRLLRPLLGENIEISLLPQTELWRVKVDPGQLEQVIVNLAVNARDAMPNGGRLTIETGNIMLDADYAHVHPDIVPGDYVQLTVSDTGQGMDEAVQQHIFEPFFTTKSKGQGTGLGLATCHGIVKQSGGHIWLYSEPGRGTTFKIYLPRVQAEPTRASAAPEAACLRGAETILLVEDESMVRSMAAQALRAQGYLLLEAGSGEEALALAAAHFEPIHLLLTDVIMSQMSGAQLAARLVETHPNIKVLYTSGYTDNLIAQHGVLEAGKAFLQKPYTPARLALKVRETLLSA